MKGELVERLIDSRLRRGTICVGDKCAVLLIDNRNASNLSKLIEIVIQILLGDFIAHISNVDGCYRLIFRRTGSRHVRNASKKLLCYRIFCSIVAILDVLIRKRVVGIIRLLVPVRTLFATAALALDVKGAYMSTIALIIRRISCQLGQNIRWRSRFMRSPSFRRI